MTVSTHTFGLKRQNADSSSLSSKTIDFLAVLRGFAGRVAAKAQAILKAAQTGRMMSVLSHMSDQQLEEIGISRSDIPQYAVKLISDE